MTTENEHNCIDKDDLMNNTKLNIDKFGLQVIMVGSTSYCPSFAYSIGLTPVPAKVDYLHVAAKMTGSLCVVLSGDAFL